MKSLQRISDAGSIPATSTTTGVLGFDGMNSCDGRPAMVPAASGSAESRRPVRWAKFQTPTMTSTQSAKRPDVPAGRGVTNAGTLAGFGPLAPYFQRCDVAWPLGLGKRAETFPKKGSIPSHDAAFTAPPRTTTRCSRATTATGGAISMQSATQNVLCTGARLAIGKTPAAAGPFGTPC